MSHMPANSHQDQPRHYQITAEGKIDPSWSKWFGGMKLVSRRETEDLYTTTLTGTVKDQAGLRGLLNRLWDLNLVLLSVREIDPNENQTISKELSL